MLLKTPMQRDDCVRSAHARRERCARRLLYRSPSSLFSYSPQSLSSSISSLPLSVCSPSDFTFSDFSLHLLSFISLFPSSSLLASSLLLSLSSLCHVHMYYTSIQARRVHEAARKNFQLQDKMDKVMDDVNLKDGRLKFHLHLRTDLYYVKTCTFWSTLDLIFSQTMYFAL